MTTLYIDGTQRRRYAWAVVAAAAILTTLGVRIVYDAAFSTPIDQTLVRGEMAWPSRGEAAVAVNNGAIVTSGTDSAVPIASLAKVMTAEVVLRADPLPDGDDGFEMTITPDDVIDTSLRRGRGESVVAVEAGEELSERQALYALLLPSANNIAISLARAVSGSVDAFVDQMNEEARRLGMKNTTYTDPSGFEPSTVSTAQDQVVLARTAMKISAFRAIVRTRTAVLPVAGVITNTDTLLGEEGFVGIKTGSDQAAGGCFLFARRVAHGRTATILYGVVLGQRGGPLIAAALEAARRLARSAGVYAQAGSSSESSVQSRSDSPSVRGRSPR